jgi:3-demethoxyubiquinol 3-hydroxylase
MSPSDRLISSLDHALRTLSGSVHAARPSPAVADEPVLDADSRRLAGALMRVNHVGERSVRRRCTRPRR